MRTGTVAVAVPVGVGVTVGVAGGLHVGVGVMEDGVHWASVGRGQGTEGVRQVGKPLVHVSVQGLP